MTGKGDRVEAPGSAPGHLSRHEKADTPSEPPEGRSAPITDPDAKEWHSDRYGVRRDGKGWAAVHLETDRIVYWLPWETQARAVARELNAIRRGRP